jgi:FkbM family methyltransferase
MKAYWNAEYRHKFDQFRKIISDQSFCIVEIGSHYGEDSLRLAETFSDSKIYCFEPDPRNTSVHRKYVDHPRISLNECAVSSQEGVQPFYQSHSKNTSLLVPEKYGWISDSDYTSLDLHNSGASSLKSGYQHALQETIEVPTIRFDSWCKTSKISAIDFAWIDVQGAERDVIEGMGEKVRNINYIWIEYGEMFYDGAMSRDETVSLLASKGFSTLKNQGASAQDLLFKRTS